MYRRSSNSDSQYDHKHHQMVRNWFVLGCNYYKGLELLKKTGAPSLFISQLKECTPKQAITVMGKVLNTIDPFTGKVNFDFSTIRFSSDTKNIESVPGVTNTPTIKQTGTHRPPTTFEKRGVSSTVKSVESSPSQPAQTKILIIKPEPLLQQSEVIETPTPEIEKEEIAQTTTPPTEEKKPIAKNRNPEENHIWQDVTVPKDAPEEIQKLKQRAVKLHKRHAYLHAQLSLVESDKERFEIAVELMEDLIPSLDKIYDQIRKWKKTGKIPLAPVEDGFKEGIQMMQKKESLRVRIWKIKRILKNKLEELDPTEIQKYQKELQEKELEFLKIEAIINNL